MSPANRTARNTAPKPIEVTAELKTLLRRLKLGRLLDTLPERLALARSEHLPHHDFLEMLLSDEVTRRDRQSALVRAKIAHWEPGMHLDAWDESTKVTYDRQLWAELTSLRFLADSYNVLVMGPVGVGKTFLNSSLGTYGTAQCPCIRMARFSATSSGSHRATADGGHWHPSGRLPVDPHSTRRRPRAPDGDAGDPDGRTAQAVPSTQ
jgi:hypothetical protein